MYVNTLLNTWDPKPSGAYRLGGEKAAQAEGFTKTQQWSHGGERDRGGRLASPGWRRRHFMGEVSTACTCWRYGVTERVRGHVNKGSPLKNNPCGCSVLCLDIPDEAPPWGLSLTLPEARSPPSAVCPAPCTPYLLHCSFLTSSRTLSPTGPGAQNNVPVTPSSPVTGTVTQRAINTRVWNKRVSGEMKSSGGGWAALRLSSLRKLEFLQIERSQHPDHYPWLSDLGQARLFAFRGKIRSTGP